MSEVTREDDGSTVRGAVEHTLEDQLRQHIQRLSTLIPRGVAQVQIEFYGGGDDGSVQQVDFIDKDGLSVRGVKRGADYEDLADTLLEEMDIDYRNNEGAFGHITIDVESGAVSIEVNYPRTVTDTETLVLK